MFRSGNRWQLHDYRKYPLNTKKCFFVFLVYVNCRYKRNLILHLLEYALMAAVLLQIKVTLVNQSQKTGR